MLESVEHAAIIVVVVVVIVIVVIVVIVIVIVVLVPVFFHTYPMQFLVADKNSSGRRK